MNIVEIRRYIEDTIEMTIEDTCELINISPRELANMALREIKDLSTFETHDFMIEVDKDKLSIYIAQDEDDIRTVGATVRWIR